MDRSRASFLLTRLEVHKTHSKKSLGQHFLIEEKILEAIIGAAEIHPGEEIIEIGPGIGTLTEYLLKKSSNLTLFELDPDLISILKEDFPSVSLVAGDALETLPAHLEALETYKVVANIPYQITTPLLRIFLEGTHRPTQLVLLIQKEVAERLLAKAGDSDRSYLSVVTELYAEGNIVKEVPPGAFIPPPKVKSAVISLKVKPRQSQASDRAFLRFVHTAFQQRRKQLKNVLAGIWGIEPSDVATLFTGLGFSEQVRAQELSLEQWQQMYKIAQEKPWQN